MGLKPALGKGSLTKLILFIICSFWLVGVAQKLAIDTVEPQPPRAWVAAVGRRWPSRLVATAAEKRCEVELQMPKESAGAITQQGFRFGFSATLAQATPHHLIVTRPRRGGFLPSFPISKQNSDLRSRVRA